MPNLTRTYRWERFEPHLGDNLELPPERRFYLEVASGLTKEQLAKFELDAKTKILTDEAVAKHAPEKERLLELEKAGAPAAEIAEGLARWVDDVDRSITDCLVEHFIKVLEPVVRLGAEPLTVDGRAITTLAEYLRLITEVRGRYNLTELSSMVHWYNSREGSAELFYERLSGGGASTLARKTGATGSQRAGR